MNRLRDLREDRDLKQSDIAKVLNISQQYYQCYESGKNEIPTRHLITLAKFYNISIDYIVGLSDEPRSLDGKSIVMNENSHIINQLKKADPKIQKAIYTLLDFRS